jgi:hypothetical protein
MAKGGRNVRVQVKRCDKDQPMLCLKTKGAEAKEWDELQIDSSYSF